MTIKDRIAGEKRVIKQLAKNIFNRGYSIEVWDGEDTVECATIEKVIDAIFDVDESTIEIIAPNNILVGTFYILLGEAPDEVIYDHSANPLCEEIFNEIIKLNS